MISCIIPCYNEYERIGHIINSIKGSLYDDIEVICVDDASTDNTYSLLSKINDSRFHIIQHKYNQGKYKTLYTGLQHTTGEYIVFIDADLQSFDFEIIYKAVILFKQQHLDMLILRRKDSLLWLQLFGLDIILSGERIIRRSSYENFFNDYGDKKGFEIELAIGKYSTDKLYKVGWLQAPWCNTYKFEKRGVIEGLVNDITMYTDIGLLEHEWYTQYSYIRDKQYYI